MALEKNPLALSHIPPKAFLPESNSSPAFCPIVELPIHFLAAENLSPTHEAAPLTLSANQLPPATAAPATAPPTFLPAFHSPLAAPPTALIAPPMNLAPNLPTHLRRSVRSPAIGLTADHIPWIILPIGFTKSKILPRIMGTANRRGLNKALSLSKKPFFFSPSTSFLPPGRTFLAKPANLSAHDPLRFIAFCSAVSGVTFSVFSTGFGFIPKIPPTPLLALCHRPL